MLVVPQADPADVQRAGVLGFRPGFGWHCVGAAEAQAVLHRVQLGQSPRLFGRRDVALEPGLEGTPGATAAVRLGQRAFGPVPRLVKQPVKHIHICLLLAYGRGGGGISLTKRHISWYTFLGLLSAPWRYSAGYESLSSRPGSR